MSDYLLELAQVPDIAVAVQRATNSLDKQGWDRSLRNRDAAFGVYVRRLSGYSSAALEGTQWPQDVMADPEKSAMGDIATSALLITGRADELAASFLKEPSKVWAQLHLLVSSDGHRGQPRTSNDVPDAMHLGHLPDFTLVQPMLLGLSDMIVTSKAPTVLLAAITHAQLCAIRPFTHGSYLIARASARMILKARGLDTLSLCAIEHGLYRLGRPAYVKSLGSYLVGGVESVTSYMEFFSSALEQSVEAVGKLGTTE